MSDQTELPRDYYDRLSEAEMKKGVIIPVSAESAKRMLDNWQYAYNAQYEKFVKVGYQNREFAFDAQYTDAELKKIAAKHQYAFTLNRLQKYIRTIVGMFTAQDPTFVAKPFGTEDNIISDICNVVFSHVMKRSNGSSVLRRAVRGGVGSAIGYAFPKLNDDGEVVIDNSPFEYVCVDPDSTHPYFNDAKRIYTHKFVDTKTISERYGIPEKELQTVAPDDLRSLYTAQNEKIFDIKHSDYKNYVRVIEASIRSVERVYNKLPDGGLIYSGKSKRKMIIETILGYRHAFVQQLPDSITKHDKTPVYYDDTDSVYKRSLTHHLKETQRFINKAFGILTYHAQIASNPITFIYDDILSESNQEDLEQQLATPGSVIYLKTVDGERQQPVFKKPDQINPAFYNILEMLFREFDFQGFNSQFFDMDIKEGNRTSQLLGSYEMMLNSVREFMAIYEGFIEELAYKVLEYFFTYTPKERIYRVCGIDQVDADIEDFKKFYGMDPYNEESIKTFMQKAQESKMDQGKAEDLIIKCRGLRKYKETLDKMIEHKDFIEYDIVVEKGSYLPSHSVYKFMIKMELFKSGLIDNESLLEDVPLKNKEQLIHRTSLLRQYQGKMEQYEEMVEELQKEVQRLQKKQYDLTLDVETEKHRAKLGKDYADKRGKSSFGVKMNNMRHMASLKDIERDKEDEYNEIIDEVKQLKYLYEQKLKSLPDNKKPIINLEEILNGNGGE